MRLPHAAGDTVLIEALGLTSRSGLDGPGGLEGECIAVWAEDEAREVLELVEALDGGERQRCFAPVYGIRAHGEHEVLFEAAFCFRCRTALLIGRHPGPASAGFQDFDPERPQARELLARFRRAAEQLTRSSGGGPG